jgi:hypothetical protein
MVSRAGTVSFRFNTNWPRRCSGNELEMSASTFSVPSTGPKVTASSASELRSTKVAAGPTTTGAVTIARPTTVTVVVGRRVSDENTCP